jgi:acetyl esterase/lipase
MKPLAGIPLAKVITPEKIDYEKEGMKFFEGVTYVIHDDNEIKMDIVIPENGMRAMPCIIWVHGGGWADKNLTRKYLPSVEILELNKKGYITVSIDYRLTGTTPFPAQIQDCKSAVRFLRNHASEYHIDGDKIAAWGESAGGHLVELMAYSSDTEFEDGTNSGESSCIQCVVPWYAPIDLRSKEAAIDSDDAVCALFVGMDGEEKEKNMEAASPILYAERKNPPTLLMHGDSDRLVDYACSQKMYEALKHAGNEVEFITVPGQGHGFFDGQEYYIKIYDFFERILKDKKEK